MTCNVTAEAKQPVDAYIAAGSDQWRTAKGIPVWKQVSLSIMPRSSRNSVPSTTRQLRETWDFANLVCRVPKTRQAMGTCDPSVQYPQYGSGNYRASPETRGILKSDASGCDTRIQGIIRFMCHNTGFCLLSPCVACCTSLEKAVVVMRLYVLQTML